MSDRYPGGIISKTAPTPTGPYENGTAPGIWSLEQQMQYQQQGIWPIAGNVPPYIEEVFSTWLYTGNGSTQTITNGIDLAGKGGLTWIKARNVGGAARNNRLWTTNLGGSGVLQSDSTAALYDYGSPQVTFNSNGFGLSSDAGINFSGDTYVSWTFRKQAKFFDVVTYTGNSVIGRAIPHSLGSAPGCVIVKSTDAAGENWAVWHRSGTQNGYFSALLNSTSAYASQGGAYWQNNGVAPDMNSATFSVGNNGATNQTGNSYVAYVFAHDAGGFGLTGTDNVISCGSFTPDAGGSATVTLGWEPQWILVKVSGTTGNWTVIDNMRNWSLGGNSTGSNDYLRPNTSGEELEAGTGFPTATGFFIDGVVAASQPHIYIAIRRGPMKVPTSGTSVFLPQVRTGTGSTTTVTTGLNSDSMWFRRIVDGQAATLTFGDKLRGTNVYLQTPNTNGEQTYATSYVNQYLNTGVTIGDGTEINQSYVSNNIGSWYLTRSPGFYDVVCYTGTGTDDRQVAHNLGVAPELIICKSRSAAWPWWVGGSVLGSTSNGMFFNTTGAIQDNPAPKPFSTNGSAFTSSYFLVSSVSAYPPNANTYTHVAYLFATCAGVSKVGSYTGTGALLTVNCGFAAGARFVLIKRTDSTGDWYVYDTARGMTSGNDPYFFTNTSDGAVTSTNYVDTTSVGFQVTAAAPAGLNASGGTYIFLAIA